MREDRNIPDSDDIENDPVWKLLAHSPRRPAGPRFVDDVVRRARPNADAPAPWWARWLAPAPAMAAASGLAAAVIVGWFVLSPATDDASPEIQVAALDAAAEEERLAHLQEVLETEMLFAAVEHLDDFSDAELITLIGF